ncbi:type II toxin-antitoxin system VapC family toxin [Altericista sp. CCNU0014]|uniref:type II toxin-antitoxin system VapC family toxin n=1 Tax=Altericista sp. CCNU0014 TaxID=3082949 RepID=UPI00385127FD
MLLLDTSGLLCYVHKSERQHWQAVQFLNASSQNLTHSYVLSEFVALALVRRFSRLATLTFVSDLLENPDIAVVWVDKALHCKAVNFLIKRPDKNYSLCDAVSFVLMHQHGIREALTTDHHFEQEGFQRLLLP